MLTESSKIKNVMDSKDITYRSCFKETSHVDIRGKLFGTRLHVTQCNFSLGLMDARTYYVSSIMKREYGI